MRRLLSGILFCAVTAAAQQIGQNAAPKREPIAVFKANSQLVIETVSVTGKDGKPVEGLSADDFTVTENGAVQAIRVFEFQRLPAAAEGAPATSSEPEHIEILKDLTHSHIAPEPSVNSRYRDRRLLALYFDMTMPKEDRYRAFSAALKFIGKQMTAADLVAILCYSGGGVNVLQDFIDDRSRLLSVIETLWAKSDEGDLSLDSTEEANVAFGQDDSEFNIFTTDRQLSALQTAVTMLAQLSEKKLLVFFSSGLMLNGTDNQAQLHATLNAAIRAGVAFWPVDARGLQALPPLGDATQSSPGGQGMYSGTAALAVTANLQQSQDTLYALAADTGGKALLDNNDLSQGIRQAQQSISSYYIVGYYTSNAAQDGKFRRVKIVLNREELKARLDYRQGYYAGKQFAQFTAADKERQLEEALMLEDPITELTIAMEVDYFQLNRAEYFVPVVVKIPGRELALAKRRGAEHTVIDFIGEIKDSSGSTVANIRDKVDIKLSDATAAQLATRPIQYDTGYTLLPGRYVLKFLARDAETGRIGTYQCGFAIPNLLKEDKRVPLSSVVLGSQRVDLKSALYNALKAKDRAETANPLVQNEQKLIPSVTRVFRTDQQLHVYLQAYEPEAAGVRPVIAWVSFYRGPEKVFSTEPVKVADGLKNRLNTIPLQFDIPLSALAPGKYDCQISVLDPTGQRTAFWRAPVVVVP
jgi:VWFA-related protein